MRSCISMKLTFIYAQMSSPCPVFKYAGVWSFPSLYSHMSLLSITSKVLDTLIIKKVVEHLENNNLFRDE